VGGPGRGLVFGIGGVVKIGGANTEQRTGEKREKKQQRRGRDLWHFREENQQTHTKSPGRDPKAKKSYCERQEGKPGKVQSKRAIKHASTLGCLGEQKPGSKRRIVVRCVGLEGKTGVKE